MGDAQASPRKTPSPSRCAANTKQKSPPPTDEYMMYTYKVIPCSRVSTHNWKLCHFSHIGEVAARRRHPSCHEADLCAWVSANKECPLGDSCNFAHNAFESWLHPDRYKTTLCSYAGSCTRKFCFFAHSAAELRTPQKQLPKLYSQLSVGILKTASLDTNCSVSTPLGHQNNNAAHTSMLQQLQPIWNQTNGASAGANCNTAAAINGFIPSTAAAAAGLSAVQLAAPFQLLRSGSDMTSSTLSRGSSGVQPFWDGATLAHIHNNSTNNLCSSNNLCYPPGLNAMDPAAAAAQAQGYPFNLSVQSPLGPLSVTPGSSSSLQHSTLPPLDSTQQQVLLLQHLISLQQQQQAQQQQQQQLELMFSGQGVAYGAAGSLNPQIKDSVPQSLQNPVVGANEPVILSSGVTAPPAGAPPEWPSADLALAPLQNSQQQHFGVHLTGLNSIVNPGLGVTGSAAVPEVLGVYECL